MAEQANSQGTILCIEDEPTMIELVKLILTSRGYEVVGANSGKEGLELIEKIKPDVVLLDLMMPDVSGWDVYQHMKASDGMKDIPVIVVTAKAQNIDKVLGLHIAKVQDYITKPFSPEELAQAIKRAMGQD